VYCYPCGVGQATCSEDGLNIASNSGLEGNLVTDRCGTARLDGQVCRREVWLHVQTVSCDDGRTGPMPKQCAIIMKNNRKKTEYNLLYIVRLYIAAIQIIFLVFFPTIFISFLQNDSRQFKTFIHSLKL